MNAVMRSIFLLCLVWLGGCTYVGTATPITDPSVPADQKLVGSWAHLKDLSLFNVIENKESNKLYVVGINPGVDGTNSCVVWEIRTLQQTDYGLFEVSIQDGAYECVSPHQNAFFINWDKYMQAGLGQFYAFSFYKISKLNNPGLAEFKENNKESIDKLINYYDVTDENPDVVQVAFLEDLEELDELIQGIQSKSVKINHDTFIQLEDTPEAIRRFFLALRSDSPVFTRWDSDGAIFIRISPPKSSVGQ